MSWGDHDHDLINQKLGVKQRLESEQKVPKKQQSNDPQLEKQKFEEILSPLIRYGYNTALADIEQYMVSIMEQYDIDTLTIIQNKIHEMMASKKLVDSEKLSIELLKRDG